MKPLIVGRPLRRYSASDFRGGLDVKSSPQELASNPKYKNRLTLARHIVYKRSGAASKRFDTAVYNTATIGASVAITGGFELKLSSGTRFIIGGTDDGRLVLFSSDGTTTNLATGLTSGRRWSFATYNDLGICVNGVDAPRKTAGTAASTTTLGGSPPTTASHVFTHGNRVFMVTADSSTLTWSALNNEEDYTTASNAGSMVVARHDGGNLLWGLSFVSEALLGKENATYRLQGTNPSTFAVTNVVPTGASVGGASFQATAVAGNEAWWGSRRGIHSLRTVQEFGDLKETFPSEKIDLYFTPNTDYTVSLNQLDEAAMCYSPQTNSLYYGVDTNNDGENDTIFVLDLFGGGWSVWPSMSCASLWIANNGANGDEVFMGGYDGFVRRLNVSASTNAIDARFNHITDLGAPGIIKILRYLRVYAAEEGNHALTITINSDFGASGGQAFTMTLLGDTATIGSTFTLGTSTLGARSQIIKRMDMGIVGEFFELGFANAQAGQPFTVHKYDARFRDRRLLEAAS